MTLRLLFFLFLFQVNFIIAQNPYAIKYSIDEGLPTSNIYSVFEDSKGYIWFGTDVGVLKFDGYNFQHFSTDDGLGDNEVFEIYEDKNSKIWFLTLNGQLSFYENGVFANSKNNALLKKASHSKIVVEIYEKGNDLFVLYRDGTISQINFLNNEVANSETSNAVFGYWNIEGKYYYLTKESIINVVNDFSYPFKKEMDASVIYRNVLHNKNYLFSIKEKLFTFEKDTIIKQVEIDSEIIHLSSIDNDLWIGSREGLIIKSSSTLKTYFKDLAVTYVLKDSQQNYWITSLNNGIRFIPNFNLIHHQVSNKHEKVNALQKDANSTLWIGTENGLYSLNNKTKSVTNRIGKQDYIKKIRFYENQIFSIGNTSITQANDISFKTLDFGANDLYFDGLTYFFSSSVVFKFPKGEIHKFPRLRDENWFKVKTLLNYTILKKRTNVLSLYKNNNFLFGTNTGLYSYDNEKVFQMNKQSEELNTSIQDIYFDAKNDNVYVATNSKGISVIKNDSIINHFTKKQGLSSNTCYVIKPINDDFLVATNKGVDRLIYKNNTYKVESLNRLLGMKNEKVNGIEIIESTIYTATDRGLFSFMLSDLSNKKTKLKVIIEKVLVNGEENSDLNQLSYKENNLTIVFTGLSYKDYGNLEYEFKLNDEKKWTKTLSRQIEFKNLPHDTYNLSIRTISNGNNHSLINSVNFKIHPPFWKTVPFVILSIFVFGLLIYTLVKYRLKKQKQKFELERIAFQAKQEKIELEKQTVQLEQKAMRMQMNPHFIFNALNTIKGYYSGGNIDEANKYISRFSKLLRLILENDEHLISLEKEVEMLELYIKLVQLRYQNSFTYAITVSPNIRVSDIGIPPLLLQPMVENAIIHGIAPSNNEGTVKITFSIANNKLICTIADNGVGINKSQLKHNSNHKSKAIHITKERVELINNSNSPDNFIVSENKGETGTTILLKLPILKLW